MDWALADANNALTIATQHQLWDMVSKAHLYRAFCFIETKEWKKARSALTKAATIKSWGGRIKSAMEAIEQGEDMQRRGLVWVEEDRTRNLDIAISNKW